MAYDDNTGRYVLRLKTAILGLFSSGAGVALLTFARGVEGNPYWAWISFWPFEELGGILVGTGVLGIAWEYFDGRDREQRDYSNTRVDVGARHHPPDMTRHATRGSSKNQNCHDN